MNARLPCRACGLHLAAPDRRGLCQTCHRDPAIRRAYALSRAAHACHEDAPAHCVHCGHRPPRSGDCRALCKPCGCDRGVRERYPRILAPRHRGCASDAEPPEPTALPDAPAATSPGTPERVAVYAARYAAGVRLYHPGDCTAPAPLRTRRQGSPDPGAAPAVIAFDGSRRLRFITPLED